MPTQLTISEESAGHATAPAARAQRVWLRLLLGLPAIGVLIGLRMLADPAWTQWLPNAGWRHFFTLSVSVMVESLPFVATIPGSTPVWAA